MLKPPGGGSSDIFGAGNEATSPRRVGKQNPNASSLGSGFFDATDAPAAQTNGSGGSSGSSTGPETPRGGSGGGGAAKPGNDSYKRLFGPPDAPPPCTPKAKLRVQSSISLSGSSGTESGGDNVSSSSGGSSCVGTPTRNGFAAVNGQQRSRANYAASNGSTNGYHHNDVVGTYSPLTPPVTPLQRTTLSHALIDLGETRRARDRDNQFVYQFLFLLFCIHGEKGCVCLCGFF